MNAFSSTLQSYQQTWSTNRQKSGTTPLPSTTSFGVGVCSGWVDSLLTHPILIAKYAIQEGRPFSLHPIKLYRGITPNLLSITPIMGTQFGGEALCYNHLTSLNLPWLSKTNQALLSSAFGGVCGGLIVGPAEVIILNQNRSGRTMIGEIKFITKEYGVGRFTRGMGESCMREGGYFLGCFGVFPIVNKYISEQNVGGVAVRKEVAFGLSSVVAGVFAALVTHPFDIAKTRLQADLSHSSPYTNFTTTLKVLIKEKGLLYLFTSGLTPRTVNLILDVTILNICKEGFTYCARSLGVGED